MRGTWELAQAELKRQEAGLIKLKKEVPLQIEIAQQTLAAARTDETRSRDNLKLTTDESNTSIEEARAAIAVAKANYTLARQEFDRFTALYKQEAVASAAPRKSRSRTTRPKPNCNSPKPGWQRPRLLARGSTSRAPTRRLRGRSFRRLARPWSLPRPVMTRFASWSCWSW